MNGVQTRFKCKLDVKRCKRFVFPPSSLLPRSNALKTKAIRYFQTDRTLTRIVSPPLYFAINLLKSEEDAEDIIQDVFAKLWTQPEVWLENKDIGQYIYAMTKNTTFNFIKRKRLEQSYQEQLSQKYLIEDLLKSEDTLDPIYYKEALLIIRLILDRLPERRRKVFEMSRINNMSNMEIAQALNISVRTVEHQIYLTLLEIKKTIFIAFFLCFF